MTDVHFAIQPETSRVKRLADKRTEWMKFLRRRLRSQVEAEDVLHSTLLKAILHAEDVRTDEALVPWFYRLLRRSVADHYNRISAEHRRINALHADLGAAGEDRTPAAVNDLARFCACLLARLNSIKPRYASLIAAVDLAGRSIADVAKEKKLSVNALNVLLHRARQALRRELERYCGPCAATACLDCGCVSEKV